MELNNFVKSGNGLPPSVRAPHSIFSKVNKVEKAEGAEVDKTEHIKLGFFMDALPSMPNTLLSSRMGAQSIGSGG